MMFAMMTAPYPQTIISVKAQWDHGLFEGALEWLVLALPYLRLEQINFGLMPRTAANDDHNDDQC